MGQGDVFVICGDNGISAFGEDLLECLAVLLLRLKLVKAGFPENEFLILGGSISKEYEKEAMKASKTSPGQVQILKNGKTGSSYVFCTLRGMPKICTDHPGGGKVGEITKPELIDLAFQDRKEDA